MFEYLRISVFGPPHREAGSRGTGTTTSPTPTPQSPRVIQDSATRSQMIGWSNVSSALRRLLCRFYKDADRRSQKIQSRQTWMKILSIQAELQSTHSAPSLCFATPSPKTSGSLCSKI
ncbi:unnamed protein product [Pleuronectes platessa]|uniref:Uncharacterized protein n=1 Tax=Pleuronectes platessa TaxID=8262 RepID=A0A9N7YEQ6_PLEPL|nr:unnamed protein product [Pleuronectes platessa]